MDRLQAVEELEIDLLLEGVFQLFGYDFRGYQRDPLRQKLHLLMQSDGLNTVSALLEKVMHDEAAGDALLRALSVHPAGLFEDPEHFLSLRGALGPWLRSCPSPKIWIAECASVQEAAALAIMLTEEQLYDKTRIFATVANESLLTDAAKGSFAPDQLSLFEDNYRRSGGTKSLAEYCVEDGGKMYFRRELLSRITWAQYNLATDSSFNEFELIVCRRALGDFGPALRRRALQLFRESLPLFGMLSVDHTSEPDDAPFVAHFKTVNAENGLYRRIA
ncbi:MAG: chemotaxis protein [Burkholderia sp.]|nr:chemotaxis protein [Burkholderia sp.]